MSVANIDSLVGKWRSAVTDNVWECVKKSSTELSCGNKLIQNKVLFLGTTITWETTGAYGSYDGHNTVTWRSGKWIRKGIIIIVIQYFAFNKLFRLV